MGTLFNWLPNTLGLMSEPNEFRKNCYKTYGGDAPRWGGYMDGCEVGSGFYELAFCFLGAVGSMAGLVGGYMALYYAKNGDYNMSSEDNPGYDTETSAYTLK
ncbi:hypothetical protein [Legionella bononiensis]|uniref:Uncharacterized protein n=1 Tax=Legionella bononiensis TaxID=2793102 RepID=A0ABS1W8X3_9GAMM|nr:hypothetical protein [Legionella bononiensis]MBL7479675.1 hypothetical protein [Legionella bononiensis]MBL7525813.1 hypothetical protein [Legionella bononiensis]MBL7561995.1 hypothetical protein [Legionella bononiensis]